MLSVRQAQSCAAQAMNRSALAIASSSTSVEVVLAGICQECRQTSLPESGLLAPMGSCRPNPAKGAATIEPGTKGDSKQGAHTATDNNKLGGGQHFGALSMGWPMGAAQNPKQGSH